MGLYCSKYNNIGNYLIENIKVERLSVVNVYCYVIGIISSSQQTVNKQISPALSITVFDEVVLSDSDIYFALYFSGENSRTEADPPNNHSVHLEIVRRGGLILFCDYVVRFL